MIKSLYIKLFFLLYAMIFVACEKKTTAPEEEDLGIDKSKTYLTDKKENQLKDDVWYYFKVLSLWQDNIPPVKYNEMYKITEDNFIQDNYTQYFRKADDVMAFLMAKTTKDMSTGEPLDRFSFLDREGVVSSEVQDAVATSYGMYVFFLQTQEAYEDNDNAYLYVRMVDDGSPAYEAGIRRGDRIISMNGRTGLDYNTQKAQDFRGINQELSSSTMSIDWRTPANVDYRKTMKSETYDFNPILNERVFVENGKKVGYLAFSSFVSVISEFGEPTDMYNNLQGIFSNFQSEGIKTLILDLRYNGGGSVATAEYLINRIVPSSANNKQMYYYKVNKLLRQEWKWTRPDSAFAAVTISKIGALELDKIYFLVTSSTASASELVINTLRAHMDGGIQVIGPERTYGKPVGFFPIPIGDDEKAEVYVTSFQMFNANGYGDYFGGLSLDKQAYEGYLNDFGDPEENLLAHALYHVKNGAYSTEAFLTKSTSARGGMRAGQPKKVDILGPRRGSDYGMFKFNQRN